MKNDDNSKSECREKEGLIEKIMMNFTNFFAVFRNFTILITSTVVAAAIALLLLYERHFYN
jgi:hypothetical protein